MKKNKTELEKNLISPEPKVLASYMTLINEGDDEKLAELIVKLSSNKFFVFDTETDGAHFMLAVMDGIGFYLPEDGSCYYINFYKTSNLWVNTALNYVKPIFDSKSIGKVGHNIIYDSHILKNTGIDINGPILDTMIAAYIANPDDRPLKLKSLVPRHLNIDMRQYKEIDRNNIIDMAIYCMEDCRCTYLLYINRKDALLKVGLWEHFITIEMPYLKVLLEMERRGIKVDVERLYFLKKLLDKAVLKYKNLFYKKMFGQPYGDVKIYIQKKIKKETVKVEDTFNIDSTAHLGVLIYTMKKYPIESWTSGGKTGIKKPSTDKKALQRLADAGHEGLDILMKYRELQKLITAFVNPILEEHMINGRVHSSYYQHGTKTGRLSSADPNFQNIPVRTSHGKALRKCFMADEGDKIIDADLSQIELRVMAHFSGDQLLLKAYRDNLDLHDLTGQEILGMRPGETSLPDNKAKRTLCKQLNFGLQYGAGPRKFTIIANTELPKSAKITEEESKLYIEKYFKKYCGVRAFQVAYPKEVRSRGYATTILGRRRYLPNIKLSTYHPDKKISNELWRKKAAAERAALSTLIQGTASDIMKLAMIKAHNHGLKIIAQIHDQLLVASAKSDVEKNTVDLKECMENSGIKLRVPVIASVHAVDRWEGTMYDNYTAFHDEALADDHEVS